MRKVVRKVVTFECKFCKTGYETIRAAMRCENQPLEEKKFKLGDRVGGREQHTCDHGRKEKYFLPNGRVIKINGPVLMDEEYSVKWLGGELLYYHVYEYLVEYDCPCGMVRQHQFYSPELKLIKSK